MATPSVRRIVCSCFILGVDQLAVAAGCSSLAEIGERLNAGTNCGSCRSEIRAVIEAGRVAAE